MEGLPGKRVVVTGGTRGIGRAVVLASARAGARVVTCHSRPGPDAQALAGELAALGGQAHRVVRADITDEADVARLAAECRDALGGVDVIVNNAGVDGQVPFGELSGAGLRRMLDIDLGGCYLVVKALLPLLADGGSIINLGASVAVRGRPAAAHYTAAKAGIIGLTRSLAKELGGRGIRVNTVAPGVVQANGNHLPPAVAEQITAMTALRRLGTPEDIAGAVLFLASDSSRYVSGATLNVDGGI